MRLISELKLVIRKFSHLISAPPARHRAASALAEESLLARVEASVGRVLSVHRPLWRRREVVHGAKRLAGGGERGELVDT